MNGVQRLDIAEGGLKLFKFQCQLPLLAISMLADVATTVQRISSCIGRNNFINVRLIMLFLLFRTDQYPLTPFFNLPLGWLRVKKPPFTEVNTYLLNRVLSRFFPNFNW